MKPLDRKINKLAGERVASVTAILTLSSTLRHLSAPHRDATRFSLSSSWLRFCTHSLTVAQQGHFHILRATRKAVAAMAEISLPLSTI